MDGRTVFQNSGLLIVVFLVIAALCGPLLASAQDTSRFWQWMKNDPVSLVSDLEPEQLLGAATFSGFITMVSLSDASTSRDLQLHYQDSRVLHFTNRWGAWEVVTPLSAGLFASSLLTRDTKFQDAAFTTMQSLIMTNILTKTGKFIFGRERPGEDDGPHDLDMFQGGATSFPSGHAATAFALFTPWVVYYPSPLTYSLMAIPVGTAIARVTKGRHWLSDVTAGAVIGFSMSYYLSKKHLNLQSKGVQVFPQAGGDNMALTINFSF